MRQPTRLRAGRIHSAKWLVILAGGKIGQQDGAAIKRGKLQPSSILLDDKSP